MSRQLEQKQEEKTSARRDAVIRSLEYGFAGALESQGIELVGFAIKYAPHNCLMTIKGEFQSKRHVAFVGAESIIGCILKAQWEASHSRLSWRLDQYHSSED